MNFNRKHFFDTVRRLWGKLSTGEVQNYNSILELCEKRELTVPEVAYILATVHWETASTIKPLAEYGKGKNRKYGKPAGPYNQRYYGRGYVQLTWLFNYEKQSKIHGVDFVKNPDLVMEPRYATLILVDGMMRGDFTGKKLSDYFSNGKKDYIGARRIINGVDKKETIANIARKYEKTLKEGKIKETNTDFSTGPAAIGTGGAAVVVAQDPSLWPLAVGFVFLGLVVGYVLWKRKQKENV